VPPFALKILTSAIPPPSRRLPPSLRSPPPPARPTPPASLEPPPLEPRTPLEPPPPMHHRPERRSLSRNIPRLTPHCCILLRRAVSFSAHPSRVLDPPLQPSFTTAAFTAAAPPSVP
jgi:hypothetical protein